MMTKNEALVISAYTGYLLVPEFSEMHQFIEKTLGRSVFTRELAETDTLTELHTVLKPKILEIIKNLSSDKNEDEQK